VLFPTVPELFTIILFNSVDGISPLSLGAMMLATIMVAEVLGVMVLYSVVSRAKVPGRIESAVRRYRAFLIVPDERMILLNRVAPVLPFLGAFIALSGWSLRRSLLYVLIGGGLKYGVILCLSAYFIGYFEDEGTAMNVSLIMVIAVLGLSLAASAWRKRRSDVADRAG